MPLDNGIRLERESKQGGLFSLEEINAILAQIGTRIWAQDWSGLSDDLKDFMADPDPSPERIAEVMPRFLLPRKRLLDIIAQAGRQPHVPGGGELTTLDETHGVTYPQLYVARAGVDFSRFDRMHVNIGTDDTPVDNVAQLLCGSGMVLHHLLPSGERVKVSLACPSPEAGWLLTVDCALPFFGSLSAAPVGTKALSQVIGSARWKMVYVE
jgi:hypothetical protein